MRLTDAVHALHQAAADGSVQERIFDDFVDASYNGMLALRGMQVYVMGAALAAGWFVLCNARFRLRLRQGRIEPISGDRQKAVSVSRIHKNQGCCGKFSAAAFFAPCPLTLSGDMSNICIVSNSFTSNNLNRGNHYVYTAPY